MIMHVDAEEATGFSCQVRHSILGDQDIFLYWDKMEFLSVQRWFLSLEVRAKESLMMAELSEKDIKKELIEMITEMQKWNMRDTQI